MTTRPWFYYFGNWFLRNAFRILMRMDLRGLENVPHTGALVIAISHSSFWDPLFAGAYIARDVVPMAKSEVFKWFIIGWIVKWYGAFPVRRGQVDTSAFKTALRILQNGECIIIAPEGHRSETGELQRGREGAIMLSLRSGAAILPVAVWGGKPFWKNIIRLRRTEIKMYVGEPVLPMVTGTKPTRQSIAAMSDELMLRIAAMMPPEMHGYYANHAPASAPHLQPYRAATMPAPAEN
ncbi:MAG: 1-acyl-sn-glycerol-3-phosphate acyltransferase [Chloroflexi bacterium]|nr:1-acyl-sn-glycerol-3-phosphate acyltransferase [Chloroflexota bacterium]